MALNINDLTPSQNWSYRYWTIEESLTHIRIYMEGGGWKIGKRKRVQEMINRDDFREHFHRGSLDQFMASIVGNPTVEDDGGSAVYIKSSYYSGPMALQSSHDHRNSLCDSNPNSHPGCF